MSQTPYTHPDAEISKWRVERDHKRNFRVERKGPSGLEVARSASGRESSFKTYSAAVRRAKRLNEDAATEAELKAKYDGQPAATPSTLGGAIAQSFTA